MKIRHSYVSNSSTTGYIIALDHIPQSVEDMKQLLFGDNNTDIVCDIYSGIVVYTPMDLAEIVYRDMQKPLTPTEVRSHASSGYLYPPAGYPKKSRLVRDYCRFRYETEDERDRQTRAYDRWTYRCADTYLAQHPDKIYLNYTYSDDSGPILALLHDGVAFENIPKLIMSYH